MRLSITTNDGELIDTVDGVEGYLNNSVSTNVLLAEIVEIVERGIRYEKEQKD